MRTWMHENLVYLVHGEYTSAANGKALAEEVEKSFAYLASKYTRIGLYSDSTLTKKSETDYLALWGEIGKRHQDKLYIAALVPSLWLRAMAKTVAMLSGIDIKVVGTHADAVTWLKSKGFVVDLPTNPASAPETPQT